MLNGKTRHTATSSDGTVFTRNSVRTYTHAVLVWCQSWRDKTWKWHIRGFCGSEYLAVKSAASRRKRLQPGERVEIVEVTR